MKKDPVDVSNLVANEDWATRALQRFLVWGHGDGTFKRVAVVEDVRFRIRVRDEKRRASRKVVVISTSGLSAEEKKSLLDIYFEELAPQTISFPTKERAAHLQNRIGVEEISFAGAWRSILMFIPRLRQREFRIPKGQALEIVVRLTPLEIDHLHTYLSNIKVSPRRVLGLFSLKGTQQSRGQLNDNRPLKGIHNCTSWIATAPLGEHQEAFMEILGADRDLLVGTNPGWWTNWLAATAAEDRVQFILLWTEKPLEEVLKTDVVSGQNLEWNFNKR